MRDIKFRAWDDLNKKWLLGYEYPNLGGFSMMGEVMAFGEYTNMLNSFKLEDWKYIKLMQFSGLKDRDGSDIYEGDILQFEYPICGAYGEQDFLHLKVIISFSGGAFWFTGGGYTDCNWHFYNAENRKVIGNIYEHPDLLK